MQFKRRNRTEKEIQVIVNQYVAGRQSVSTLKTKHNISGSRLYKMLSSAGVKRRELTTK